MLCIAIDLYHLMGRREKCLLLFWGGNYSIEKFKSINQNCWKHRDVEYNIANKQTVEKQVKKRNHNMTILSNNNKIKS